MVVAFDTLKASRRLRDAGFEERQAEALVNAFAEDIGANLATKDDIAQLRKDMTGEIDSLRKDMTSEFEALRKDMAAERALLDQRVKLRIALGLGSATTVLLTALGIVAGIIISRI